MKIKLADIERPLIVKLDKSIKSDGVNGIMTYGEDNDYPQKIERIINNSITAKASASIYAKFLTGSGFNANINNIVIGYDYRGQKITIRKLLSQVSHSISYYNGVFLHLNFNLAQEVTKVSFLNFKNCRFAKLDDRGYTAKIGYYDNFHKEKKEKFDKKKIKFYHIYNDKPNVLTKQIRNAGSIEKFTGQVHCLFLDNMYLYPISPFDVSSLDADTEAQLALHRNNEVRNGFTSKTIFVVPENPINSDLTSQNEKSNLYNDHESEIEKDFAEFVGPDGEKVMVIEVPPNEKGDINADKAVNSVSLDSNIDSDLYNDWQSEITNNIRKSVQALPAILIDYEQSNLGNTSGEAVHRATDFYNEMTKDDRQQISDFFGEIFSRSVIPELKNNVDWSINALSLSSVTDENINIQNVKYKSK